MSMIAPCPQRRRALRLPFVRGRAGVPQRNWNHPPAALDLQRESARRAAALERERILRDLHDGCGGQLLAALRLAQGRAPAERIASALCDCIDDLRITLDGLDGPALDLAPLLAAQRDRMEARLEGLPLRLDWRLDLGVDLTAHGPDHGLHVLRIVQEAFANVLKHAHARVLTIEGRVESAARRELHLRIRDDGIGLGGGQKGRGLDNMRRRAGLVGGRLTVRALGGASAGTEVELCVPLRTD